MPVLYHIANALVLPPAMFFMYNFYKLRGQEINFRKLPISISIIVATSLVTISQFIFPEIIPTLERNRDALFSGEVWRLFTPLFIQPMGLWQCLFNGVFLIVFLPIAEHFYGRRLLLIYFLSGLVGQIANYYWGKSGGGSSTAIYGVVGALLMYVAVHRKFFPKGYVLLPAAAFSGAMILCFFEDGHAPSMLFGGLLSFTLMKSQSESPRIPSDNR